MRNFEKRGKCADSRYANYSILYDSAIIAKIKMLMYLHD